MKIDEYHLKITKPEDPDIVIKTFFSEEPLPRISVDDCVEGLIEDKRNIPEGKALIVTRVQHLVHRQGEKTYFTTRLDTQSEEPSD